MSEAYRWASAGIAQLRKMELLVWRSLSRSWSRWSSCWCVLALPRRNWLAKLCEPTGTPRKRTPSTSSGFGLVGSGWRSARASVSASWSV